MIAFRTLSSIATVSERVSGDSSQSGSTVHCVRRGRTEEALFWTYDVITSGYARYWWRRAAIWASEEVSGDLGLCAAVGQLAQSAALASKDFSGRNEGIIEAQVIIALCRAEKSREACDAIGLVHHAIADGFRIQPHRSAVDMHTRRGRASGKSLRDFRFEGRYVAGPRSDDARCRNDFEARLWGARQPYLARPDEDPAEADIELPPLHWADE